MTHHLFLAVVCLTTVFDDYLSIVSITYSLPITDRVAMPTWWQLGNSYQIAIGIAVSLCYLPRVCSEALEALAIDQSSSQWLVRSTTGLSNDQYPIQQTMPISFPLLAIGYFSMLDFAFSLGGGSFRRDVVARMCLDGNSSFMNILLLFVLLIARFGPFSRSIQAYTVYL